MNSFYCVNYFRRLAIYVIQLDGGCFFIEFIEVYEMPFYSVVESRAKCCQKFGVGKVVGGPFFLRFWLICG